MLILSPDPAPPHEDQHNQAQGEEGWGRGGRPAPRKGWVLCKASLLLSAALSQFGSEPGVMVRRPLGRRVLVQHSDSSGLVKGHTEHTAVLEVHSEGRRVYDAGLVVTLGPRLPDSRGPQRN